MMWHRLQHYANTSVCMQKYRGNICNYFIRSLYSKTGSWANTFNKETRVQLESHWKPELKIQHENYLNSEKVSKEKYYVLSMFPYPSGQLHMGHVRVYTISDTMARYHRLVGKAVIHPMGWDAFGLPAENAAIDRGEKPDKWTYSNIENMKKQIEDLCCSFDWNRELTTCHPSYYKWTQFLFLKMHEAGLVYQKQAPVNWDPEDQTVLADEQIDGEGRSWRSGALVERRFLRQWYIRTTAYSKALLEGLEEVDADMWKDVTALQRNWIGECNGCRFNFQLKHNKEPMEPLSIFTFHPEGIFGVAFIAVSPDHYLNDPKYYQDPSSSSGGDIMLNVTAVHPFTQKEVPVMVWQNRNFGENLDSHMGIPSFDGADKEFADKHKCPYREVLERSADGNEKLTNSKHFTGMNREDAFSAVAEFAKECNCGGDITSERARDWLISRQRYWGTPIPMIHCDKYGTQPVPYEDLPVLLPEVDEFSGKGASPLATADNWLKVKCPKCDCGGFARRETDTMDTFVDSSWYFLRYLDAHNEQVPFSPELAHQNMPVDLYIGGKEHAIMHLYYARFFAHFLHEQGWLPQREPFIHLLTQGMVMGRSYKVKATGRYIPPHQVDMSVNPPVEKETRAELIVDWEKMSKSKYNGVDPQEVLLEYGCDSTRLCILSNVAPKSDRQWSNDAFTGVLRWQSRMWSLVTEFLNSKVETQQNQQNKEVSTEVDQQIADVRNYFLNEITHHMEKTFSLSVAISRLQGLTNALKKTPRDVIGSSPQFERALCDCVIMMSPFAPMFASELWAGISSCPNKSTLYNWNDGVLEQQWPTIDAAYKPSLKVKINNNVAFQVPLPLALDELESLTQNQALKFAEKHSQYKELVAPHNIDSSALFVETGLRAELHYVIEDLKKKKKKAKKRKDIKGENSSQSVPQSAR